MDDADLMPERLAQVAFGEATNPPLDPGIVNVEELKMRVEALENAARIQVQLNNVSIANMDLVLSILLKGGYNGAGQVTNCKCGRRIFCDGSGTACPN